MRPSKITGIVFVFLASQAAHAESQPLPGSICKLSEVRPSGMARSEWRKLLLVRAAEILFHANALKFDPETQQLVADYKLELYVRFYAHRLTSLPAPDCQNHSEQAAQLLMRAHMFIEDTESYDVVLISNLTESLNELRHFGTSSGIRKSSERKHKRHIGKSFPAPPLPPAPAPVAPAPDGPLNPTPSGECKDGGGGGNVSPADQHE